MGDKSNIGWTDATLNFVTGCTAVSEGCQHCYAADMTKRLQAMGQKKYERGFDEVVCHSDEKLLTQPKRWKKPRRIFVNSMSDTFHQAVPDWFLGEMYAAMLDAPQHIFQILTKRPERMLSYLEKIKFEMPWNIFHGVTVENYRNMDRLKVLRRVPSKVKFVSFEPLIGNPLPAGGPKFGQALTGMNWVIIGAESGNGARPVGLQWFHDLIEEARECHCAVFVKQLGPVWAKENGSDSYKGEVMSEWPDHLQIQEAPWDFR